MVQRNQRHKPSRDSDVGLLPLILSLNPLCTKCCSHKKIRIFTYDMQFLEMVFLKIFQRLISLWSLMILSRVLVSQNIRRVPRAASRTQVRLLSNANFPLNELVYKTNIWLEHLLNCHQSYVTYKSYKCNVIYHKPVYMNNVYNLI